MKKNNNVITYKISKYKIITKLFTYYIVITFSPSCFGLSFSSPLIEGSLIYGTLNKNETLYISNTFLNIGINNSDLFEIKKNKDNQFVIAIPQDAITLSLTLKTGNNIQKLSYPVISRQWDEEVVSGLQPDKVSPSTKNSARIAKEASEMRILRQNSITDFFPYTWIRPVKFTRISSSFGSRRILNNIKKQGHSGVDYATPIGTSIQSPAPGKVVYVNPDVFLTGKTVMIDHGYGVFSSYSHLNEISVKQGQFLKQGDLIGQVGTTGRSSGPHLHFTITWYGVRIDPETLF